MFVMTAAQIGSGVAWTRGEGGVGGSANANIAAGTPADHGLLIVKEDYTLPLPPDDMTANAAAQAALFAAVPTQSVP